MPQEPPPPLRFDCPACQASLTVPATAIGMRGPCPKCWKEIISPDPAIGQAARLAESPAAAPSPARPPEPTVEAEVPESHPPTPETRSFALPLAAVFMVTALAFSTGGYFLGKLSAPPTRAGDVMSFPPPPVDPTIGEAAPGTPIDPAPSPPPTTPESTLQAFLNAPTWKERAKHVLWPDEVEAAMRKHATDFGDGPIQTDSITLLEINGANHIFKVCTPNIPQGYPVAVTETDEGPMIDWESFIGFHDDQFKAFIEGPAGQSGTFNLLARPDPDETSAANFVRYILSVPMPERGTTAYVRRDSMASAKLLALFNGAAGFDEDTLETLAETGVPVVLTVSKRQTEGGQEYFQIEEFVATGWGPASR